MPSFDDRCAFCGDARTIGASLDDQGHLCLSTSLKGVDVCVCMECLETGDIEDRIKGLLERRTAFIKQLDGGLSAREKLDSQLPLSSHPFDLASPIVITEDEYNDGWEQDDPDQVVFVLPNAARQQGNLLESAKMLMACVPNGI